MRVHYINRTVTWTEGGSEVIFACGRMQQVMKLKTTTDRTQVTCMACRKMMGLLWASQAARRQAHVPADATTATTAVTARSTATAATWHATRTERKKS